MSGSSEGVVNALELEARVVDVRSLTFQAASLYTFSTVLTMNFPRNILTQRQGGTFVPSVRIA